MEDIFVSRWLWGERERDLQIRSENESERAASALISALLIARVAVKLKHLDLISELGVPSFHHQRL